MIFEGMLEKGLAVTRAVHDRYSPFRRNPYNEIECSDHYSRSMASHGVLLAVCGFDYHGPKGYLSFNPKLTPHDFKAPFTAAEGWGSFAQKRSGEIQENELELAYGRLRINTISLGIESANVNVKLSLNGKPVQSEIKETDGKCIISFEEKTMEAGELLKVAISA